VLYKAKKRRNKLYKEKKERKKGGRINYHRMLTYIITFSNIMLTSTILYILQVSMSWQKLMCLVMQNHGEFASFSCDVQRDRVTSPCVPV
jgi:hypothetical protein